MNSLKPFFFFCALILLYAFGTPCRGQDADRIALEIGRQAAKELMGTLKAELAAAMRGGGPAAAIQVCSNRAQILTASIPEKIGHPQIGIKRTSLHYRNPANRPVEQESSILQEFESLASEGRKIEPRLIEGDDQYQYYDPILTGKLCLVCHGREERIPAAVQEAIRSRYPDDRATGFEVDDLRGMVVVTIPFRTLERQ